MTRRLCTLAALVACAALVVVLAAGATRLDERYRGARFSLPRPTCPLAVARDGSIISPMCSATPGW